MQRSSSGLTISTEWFGEQLIVGGLFGGAVILAGVAAGQPAGSSVALGLTVYFLSQFRASRECRGPAGEPEL